MSRPSFTRSLVIAILLSVLYPAAASASERVLGMNIESAALSAKERGDLFKVLQAKLTQYPNVSLVQPPGSELTDEMIDLECIDIDVSCLSRLGTKYGADKVFYAQVDKSGSGLEILVRVVDANKATLLRDKRVKVARAKALSGVLEGEIEAVLGQPPASEPPEAETPPEPAAKPGLIVIDTDLPTATVYVDGEYAGTGTATIERPPGSYVLRVTQQGYEEVILVVPLKPGETVKKDVQMKLVEVSTTPAEPADGGGEGDSDWVLWAAIGATVVVGAITAVVLLSDDGDDTVRGPVRFSLDANNAWQDKAVLGGRP